MTPDPEWLTVKDGEAKTQADRLRCPACEQPTSRVIGKHYRARDKAIVRRHQCGECGQRFTSEQRVRAA
jgi:DNA-directed RNA polymerase subunit M/transcription elongation factor TFIIS